MIASTCGVKLEVERESTSKKKKIPGGARGENAAQAGCVAKRGLPVALLERYANPLLNFIFLIPLIRSGGIKPAGKNPC